MDQKDSAVLRSSFLDTCKAIQDMIKTGISKEDRDNVRFYLGILGSYTRLRAVENNEQMIGLSVARELASDKEELKTLIKKQLPEYATP